MKKKIISTLWYAVVPALVIPLFCLFQRMKIKNNRIINTVAAHTLGIYLFHLSPFVKDFLFYNLIDEAGIYNSEFFFVYLFIVPLLIFIGCFVVDVVKSVCYEKPLLKWIEKHEEQFCSRFVKTFSWFLKIISQYLFGIAHAIKNMINSFIIKILIRKQFFLLKILYENFSLCIKYL